MCLYLDTSTWYPSVTQRTREYALPERNVISEGICGCVSTQTHGYLNEA